MKSEGFKSDTGLRQAGEQSPTVLNVYVDNVMKKQIKK